MISFIHGEEDERKIVMETESSYREKKVDSGPDSNTSLVSFASKENKTDAKETNFKMIDEKKKNNTNEMDNELYHSFPFLFPSFTDGGIINSPVPSSMSYIDIVDTAIAKHDTVYSTGQNPFVVYEIILTTQLIEMRKIKALDDNQNCFKERLKYVIKNEQQTRIYRRYDLFTQLHKSLLQYLMENTEEIVTFLNRREEARHESCNENEILPVTDDHDKDSQINKGIMEKSTKLYTKSNLLPMLLPPLPKKSNFVTSHLFGFGGQEEKEIEKLNVRQKNLELYLKSLLKEDILRTSDTLRAFFDIDSFTKSQRSRLHDRRDNERREGDMRLPSPLSSSSQPSEAEDVLKYGENKNTKLNELQYPENPPVITEYTPPRSASLTSFSDTLISNSVYNSRVNQDVVRNALNQSKFRKSGSKRKKRRAKRRGSQESYNSNDSMETDTEGTVCTLNLCTLM